MLDTGALRLHLEFGPEGALLLHTLQRFDRPANWAAPARPTGLNLRSASASLTGFSSGTGFQHAGHSHRLLTNGAAELSIHLEHPAPKLRATLLLTAFPQSPVLDLSVRLHNLGQEPICHLSRFDPLSIALPRRSPPLRAHWVTRNNYKLRTAVVTDSLSVDGGNWNGPDAAGWLALEDPASGDFLFAGIEWERHWAFDLQPEDEGKALRLSAGLRKGSTVDLPPGASLDSPRVFLGLAHGDLDDAANTSRDYLLAHVLPPLPAGFPFLAYNIWSTEGENVERRMLDEARFAAEKLGVEVFYQDASWYRGSDVTGKERWGVGLGGYTEDARKLPSGLRHLSDVVQSLGMKFGLWVCPEMVDISVMEREGIPDQWMTSAGGEPNVQKINGWNPLKMLCLGSPLVEEHLRKQLLRLVRDYKLDWLKWDASGLPGLDIACDRTDHGHQASNGSLAAMNGKYRILDSIRQEFPNLILEQCSYGTRLDLGMARHGARVNWLSDSTAPSSHVRDNVMAAAYILPSSHNMTWVMRDAEIGKPQTPAFLDTIIRSRMMGAFGFGTLHGTLQESVSLYPQPVIDAAVRNLKDYKRFRHLLSQHVYHLTPFGQTNSWQAMQFTARNGQESVAFFFRNGATASEHQFRLRGLSSGHTYDISRLNTSATEPAAGELLLQRGAEVRLARDPEESEILFLKRRN